MRSSTRTRGDGTKREPSQRRILQEDARNLQLPPAEMRAPSPTSPVRAALAGHPDHQNPAQFGSPAARHARWKLAYPRAITSVASVDRRHRGCDSSRRYGALRGPRRGRCPPKSSPACPGRHRDDVQESSRGRSCRTTRRSSARRTRPSRRRTVESADPGPRRGREIRPPLSDLRPGMTARTAEVGCPTTTAIAPHPPLSTSRPRPREARGSPGCARSSPAPPSAGTRTSPRAAPPARHRRMA